MTPLDQTCWPQDGLEAVERCPVCDSPDRSVLHTELRDWTFFCAPGKWRLQKCHECATVYLDPRPSPESLTLAYGEYFTHVARLAGRRTGLRWLLSFIDSSYQRLRFGFQPNFRDNICGSPLYLWTNRRRAVEAGMRNMPRCTAGGRLLDLGCGNGEFMLHARNVGWQVVGADLDPKAVRAARSNGLNVYEGGIDVFGSDSQQFDAITLSHVIEHVYDPVETLRSCRRLLRTGGWIWIDTPNIEAIGHDRFGADWRGLEPPRHLVIFARKSLIRSLKEAGFSDISDSPYRPLCAGMFAASMDILLQRTGSGKHNAAGEQNLVKQAEEIAYRMVEKREHVTLLAWNRGALE